MTEFKQIIGRGTRVRDDYGKLLLQHPRLHRHRHPPLRRPRLRRRSRPHHRRGDGRRRRNRSQETRSCDPRRWRGEPIADPESLEPVEDAISCRTAQVLRRRRLGRDRRPPGLRTRRRRQAAPRRSDTPTTPPRRCAACTRPPPISARSGPTPSSAPRSSRLWKNAASTSRNWPKPPNQPDADPFDLLCHVAFNAPLRTRRERAERLRQEQKDFFDQYGPEAREVLGRAAGQVRRATAPRSSRSPTS